MVFWIFIWLIAACAVFGILIIAADLGSRGGRYGWRSAGSGLGWLGVSFTIAVVGLCVVGIGAGSSESVHTERVAHHTLRALVTKTNTETHGEAVFFLGFGSASTGSTEVKTISYIQTASDGGSTLQKATIDESVIYEDGAAQPYVDDYEQVGRGNGWWVPWDFRDSRGDTIHHFHIPKGSILQTYEVKP